MSDIVERNEINQKSKGGTELAVNRVLAGLDPELLQPRGADA